jgi:hypothetical protein
MKDHDKLDPHYVRMSDLELWGALYEVRSFPYFSTGIVHVIQCKEEDCTYATSKTRVTLRAAVKAYHDHWLAKHLRSAEQG